MSPAATIFAYIGGAIFIVLFVWKSRDFYKEAWNDAQANHFPPRKCRQVAIVHTTLRWLLLVGSFVVLAIVSHKAGSLAIGLGVMAVWATSLIVLIIKITRSMPIKAKDLANESRPAPQG
jgi:hypothetical protein